MKPAILAGLLLLLAEVVAAVRLWLLTRDTALVIAELDRWPVAVPAPRPAPAELSVIGGRP